MPELWVTLSSDVCPEIREYERWSTACANAYVQPVMAGLPPVDSTSADAARFFSCPVFLITSAGGLTTLETARTFPIRLVESGPAGGAILAIAIGDAVQPRRGAVLRHGRHHGQDLPDRRRRAAAFAHLRGGAGLSLPEGQRPAAAHPGDRDGGDRRRRRVDRQCRCDAAHQVGPESAGAEPGPACYGRGGDARGDRCRPRSSEPSTRPLCRRQHPPRS